MFPNPVKNTKLLTIQITTNTNVHQNKATYFTNISQTCPTNKIKNIIKLFEQVLAAAAGVYDQGVTFWDYYVCFSTIFFF